MFLQDDYSLRGPAPRDPASMLRSFLLFLLTKPEIGITAWVDELYRVPLYTILSGFVPGDVAGVGTFYDFFARLWGASEKTLSLVSRNVSVKPFFQSQFLAVSARFGLLGDMGMLGVAGDGRPVVTAAYPRSKPTCDCHAQGVHVTITDSLVR